MREHVHAERAGEVGELTADPPEADDPERRACGVAQLEPVARLPVACLHRGAELRQPLQQREREREGTLGDRARVRAGRDDDRDPARPRRLYVDPVDADAAPPEHAQLRRSRDVLRRHRSVAPNDQRLGLRQQRAPVADHDRAEDLLGDRMHRTGGDDHAPAAVRAPCARKSESEPTPTKRKPCSA